RPPEASRGESACATLRGVSLRRGLGGSFFGGGAGLDPAVAGERGHGQPDDDGAGDGGQAAADGADGGGGQGADDAGLQVAELGPADPDHVLGGADSPAQVIGDGGLHDGGAQHDGGGVGGARDGQAGQGQPQGVGRPEPGHAGAPHADRDQHRPAGPDDPADGAGEGRAEHATDADGGGQQAEGL